MLLVTQILITAPEL